MCSKNELDGHRPEDCLKIRNISRPEDLGPRFVHRPKDCFKITFVNLFTNLELFQTYFRT